MSSSILCPFSQNQYIENILAKKGYSVSLGRRLKGGTVSCIDEGLLQGEKIIIKHTHDFLSPDPGDFPIPKQTQNIDFDVLSRLQSNGDIKVPRVLYHDSQFPLTIMEDLRSLGFVLLSDKIADGSLSLISAKQIGKSLALLARSSKGWIRFKSIISPKELIYERGVELRIAYPDKNNFYLELEKTYTNGNNWTWADAHPKNIFVNPSGDVAFIDFGFSHYADQQFILPNFLSHVSTFALAGYIDKKLVAEYLLSCFEEYIKYEPITQKLFCKYFGMEVLHRANGKWLSGISTYKQKLKIYEFGLRIFDQDISSMKTLITLLNKILHSSPYATI